MNIKDNPIFTSNVDWWLARSLRNRFSIVNFVETGTGKGYSAAIAARLFCQIYTIEINPEVFKRDFANLKSLSNVERFLGDSPQILRTKIIPKLRGNTIFFLDAHWSGEGPKYGKECPVLDELDAIGQRDLDVILIDDVRLFLSTPCRPHDPAEWPEFSVVCERAPKRHCKQVIGDLLWITPQSICIQ